MDETTHWTKQLWVLWKYGSDDGQCCSHTGYCGPEYDEIGWINYDKDGYYTTEEDALAAHCTDPLGDCKVYSCTPDSKSSASSKIYSFYILYCVISEICVCVFDHSSFFFLFLLY